MCGNAQLKRMEAAFRDIHRVRGAAHRTRAFARRLRERRPATQAAVQHSAMGRHTKTGPSGLWRWGRTGRRSFAIFELAVDPGWQRRGIGWAVHDRLTRGLRNERVILNCRPNARAAQAFYPAGQGGGPGHP